MCKRREFQVSSFQFQADSIPNPIRCGAGFQIAAATQTLGGRVPGFNSMKPGNGATQAQIDPARIFYDDVREPIQSRVEAGWVVRQPAQLRKLLETGRKIFFALWFAERNANSCHHFVKRFAVAAGNRAAGKRQPAFIAAGDFRAVGALGTFEEIKFSHSSIRQARHFAKNAGVLFLF